MSRATFILIPLIICIALSAHASWMGQTWLLVKTESVVPHEKGSGSRTARLRILRRARVAGRDSSFGMDMPGKTVSVDLSFPDSRAAAALGENQTFWVEHQAATWIARDEKTGKRIPGSSSRWTYRGDVAGPLLPIERAEQCPKSPEVSLVWHFRQNNIISLMLRYPTFGNYNPRFRLYRESAPGGDDGTTITLCIAYSMTQRAGQANAPVNAGKTDEYFLQFDAKEFAGRRVSITSAGKRLAFFDP